MQRTCHTRGDRFIEVSVKIGVRKRKVSVKIGVRKREVSVKERCP